MYNRGEFVTEGIEIFPDISVGRLIAEAAKITNLKLLRSWLDINFPEFYGPDRNESDHSAIQGEKDTSKLGQAAKHGIGRLFDPRLPWSLENCSKAARILNGSEPLKPISIQHDGGEDWLDHDGSRQVYCSFSAVPSLLDTNLISSSTKLVSSEGSVPVVQSYSGLVFRASGVVGLVSDINIMTDYDDGHLPPGAKMIMRAWRTE